MGAERTRAQAMTVLKTTVDTRSAAYKANAEAMAALVVADAMLEKGVYVIGFSFPVVPRGEARIRVQLSAAHTCEDVEFAMEKFTEVRDALEA